MAHTKKGDFTITSLLNIASERNALNRRGTCSDRTIEQLPFFLGLANSPLALRRVVEAIILAVHWTVIDVANSGTYTVGVNDVVILSGHSSTITLPSLSETNSGRILFFKDKSGAAATSGQAITINRTSSDTIDGSNTSFSLNANYGAVLFVGGNGTEWHTIALV